MDDFQREAKITGPFHNHPQAGAHVVKVNDAGLCSTHNVHYIVMELLEGRNLEARLKDGVLSSGELIRIADALADVLDFAHARNIVHRDLNPRNIFLATVAGNVVVKVLDFGIAKILDDSRGVTRRLIGTPEFMSPEQYLAEGISARTDIWAFGLVIFTLLTVGAIFREKRGTCSGRRLRGACGRV